jgi:hypothetical protein
VLAAFGLSAGDSSVIVIDMDGSRAYNVELFENLAVTPDGDAVPQPGLKPVGRKPTTNTP